MYRKKTFKNWDKKEIAHLKKKLKKVKKEENLSNYWMIMLIAVLAGAVSAAAIATANIVIPSLFLVFITGILAWGLGNSFTAAILEIDEANNTHHFLFGIIVLITSSISFSYIMGLSFFEQLTQLFGIEQNPLLMGVVYGVFFLTPFVLRIVEVQNERVGHPLR